MRLLLAVITLLFSSSLLAVTVDDVYQAQVPVLDKSEEERSIALSNVFSKVILKVTGDPEVALRDDVRSIDPQRFLSSFGYVSDPESGDSLFQASFSPSLIDEFLQQKGIPVWGVNRPMLLFWVEVVDAGYEQTFAQNTGPDAEQFLTELKSSGLAVSLPKREREVESVFESFYAGAASSSEADVASDEYEQDGYALVRIINRGNGWRVTGYLLHHNVSYPLEAVYSDYSSAVQGLAGDVAQYLAQRYAIIESQTASAREQIVVVNKVDSYRDYQSLLSVLEGTPGVRSVSLVGAQNASTRLALNLTVSWRQVLNNLSLEPRLKSAGAPGVFVWNN